MFKLKNAIARYGAVPCAAGVMTVGAAFPAFAANDGSTATLTDTLSTFTSVFQWFLDQGGLLLEWMLDKPIILLSLSIFFVGAVVGVLGRIYHSF